MIKLKGLEPFARGGNRLCFVDPSDPNRCIKVRRPEFTLEDLRKRKGFPHTMFPAAWLDESIKEHRILDRCQRRLGDKLNKVVAKHYGFVGTDMGQGLCSELIRNADGRISISVMEYVWENGKTDSLMSAVKQFENIWPALLIPSRDLLLHNVVAQTDHSHQIVRLVVIDGLGYSGMIPFGLLPRTYKEQRAVRKINRFRTLIDEQVKAKQSGIEITNQFWKQKHDGLVVKPEENLP